FSRDWSSDVCSSDLHRAVSHPRRGQDHPRRLDLRLQHRTPALGAGDGAAGALRRALAGGERRRPDASLLSPYGLAPGGVVDGRYGAGEHEPVTLTGGGPRNGGLPARPFRVVLHRKVRPFGATPPAV